MRMGLFTDWFLHAMLWSAENKVMAGGTPANPAALAPQPHAEPIG